MDVSEFMNKCKYFDLDCVSLEKIVQSANRKTQAPDAESKQVCLHIKHITKID